VADSTIATEPKGEHPAFALRGEKLSRENRIPLDRMPCGRDDGTALRFRGRRFSMEQSEPATMVARHSVTVTGSARSAPQSKYW